MKANTPSLIFYFAACIFTVLFTIMEQQALVLYAKSLVVPSIFVYYFVTNNYKIDYLKGFIFIFAFIGDVVILTQESYSETVSVVSFLTVYVFLLTYIIKHFRKIKYSEKTIFLTIGLIAFMAYLTISILSLELAKMQTDFSIIIVYSILLSLIICISVINYVTKNNFTSLSLLLMSICFLFSDIFYVINGFYMSLTVFSTIEMGTQVFSYFFMVNYFIENDKFLSKQLLNNN